MNNFEKGDIAEIQARWNYYRTIIETWFCYYGSFSTNTNHLCKYLIVMYIEFNNLQSNKSPMSDYNQVWYQTIPLIIWIIDIYDKIKLFVRDLRSDIEILLTTLNAMNIDLNNLESRNNNMNSIIYDNLDEEEDENEKKNRRDIMK